MFAVPPLCIECKYHISHNPSGFCSECEKSGKSVRGKKGLNISEGISIEGMSTTQVVQTAVVNTATVQTAVVNTDLKIVKIELFDPNVMDAILKDTKSFSKRDLTNLSRYKRGRLHGNSVEVVYHYGTGCEADQLGRLYPHGGQGLQAFPFDMRNPLLEKYYWDCDMENAHYIFLSQLADGWGLKTEAIKYYINNRDECLKRISSNRGIAKTAYLKVAYGGQIKLYSEYYNDDGIAPEGDCFQLREVEAEMKKIVDYCWMKYKQHHKKVAKKPNPMFSLFALILQTEESHCLLAMDAYLKTVGRQMDIFIHDGGEVRKLEGETAFPTEHLRGMEMAVLKATGYKVNIVVKPWKHGFKMPEETAKEVIDDEYAGRFFVKLCGDLIARDGDKVYFFNEHTGLWNEDDTAYRTMVIKHKEKLLFKNGDDIINYGGKECNVVNMKKWILCCQEDTQFIHRNADSSKYKLLFTDGIYDFTTGIFTEGFDPKIVFSKRINRPFPRERNEEIIKQVNNILFVSAFDETDGKAVGEYMKKAMCIGIIGDYRRKKFHFAIGEADCGKGVLTDAMVGAFDGYVCCWDANNLKYNPRNGQDEAKKLAWMKNTIGCRIAIGNEFRMDKVPIDGNLLKAMSSGGDEMKTRINNKDEEKFINRCSMWVFANDLPDFTPKDSGTTVRVRVGRYRNRFVDKPLEECVGDERPKDSTLKDKFLFNKDYQDAVFYVMVDAYAGMTETEKQWNGTLYEPPALMVDTKEWAGDVNADFKSILEERFEITNNPNDVVLCKSIIDFIVDERKQRLSDQKIGRYVSNMITLPEGIELQITIKGKKYRKGIRERDQT